MSRLRASVSIYALWLRLCRAFVPDDACAVCDAVHTEGSAKHVNRRVPRHHSAAHSPRSVVGVAVSVRLRLSSGIRFHSDVRPVPAWQRYLLRARARDVLAVGGCVDSDLVQTFVFALYEESAAVSMPF